MMLQNVTLSKVKGKIHLLHAGFPGFRIDKSSFSPEGNGLVSDSPGPAQCCSVLFLCFQC